MRSVLRPEANHDLALEVGSNLRQNLARVTLSSVIKLPKKVVEAVPLKEAEEALHPMPRQHRIADRTAIAAEFVSPSIL